MCGATVEEYHLLTFELDGDGGNLARRPRTDALGTQFVNLSRMREDAEVKLRGFFRVVIEPEEWRNFVHGWHGSKKEVSEDKGFVEICRPKMPEGRRPDGLRCEVHMLRKALVRRPSVSIEE